MQIQKLEFKNKADERSRTVSFRPNCINIVVTNNDFDKSCFIEAIQTLLYGQSNNHITEQNSAYQASKIKDGTLWLELKDRKMQLHRDLAEQLLSIEDTESQQLNHDMLSAQETSTLGLKLTGLSSSLFRKAMIIDQDSARSDQFITSHKIAQMLEQYSGQIGYAGNLENAIKQLERKCQQYSFEGKSYQIDELISALTEEKDQLEERLSRLDSEHQIFALNLEELNNVENEINLKTSTLKRREYFRLCLSIADLDTQILKVEERIFHEQDLQEQLNEFGNLRAFPIDSVKQVEELWTKREARLIDLVRLKDEITKTRNENTSSEENYLPEDARLNEYGLEDAQLLYTLGRSLESAQAEYIELQTKRDAEMRRVKESGMDFDKIATVRKTLLSIKILDLEKVNFLFQQVREAKDTLSKTAAESSRLEAKKIELNEDFEKLSYKSRRFQTSLGAGTLFPAVVLVIAAIYSKQYNMDNLLLVSATAFVVFLGLTCLFPLILSGLKSDFLRRIKQADEEHLQASQQESVASQKLAELQRNADYLAKKYELNSGIELFKLVQSYASASAQLKELDLFDHMLMSRQSQIEALASDIELIFRKTDRKLSKATLNACSGLANEIYRFHEHQHRLSASETLVNHRISELKFLEGELSDIHSLLRDRYYAAKLEQPEDIESSYAEFQKKASNYARWVALSQELDGLKQDLTVELLNANLSSVLSGLRAKRGAAWEKMRKLIIERPEIATTALSSSELKETGKQELDDELVAQIAALRVQSNGIRIKLQQSNRNFDEYYPQTQYKFERLEQNLELAKRNKLRLERAKDKLKQLQIDFRHNWSKELSAVAKRLLQAGDSEFNHLDWDDNLQIRVQRHGSTETITENELANVLTKSAFHQVNWLSRMTLCLLLAEKTTSPLLINDPFTELDDQRFLAAMRLLIHQVLSHCQIFVFSCHQVRHKWLIDQLLPEEKDMVNLILSA